ncbi:MAG: cytochrome c-type biogenesis protein CcmH [Gammaproteobacteria bacterium]|nr:cytochrome c-type biogenesis protein CcmH [Gammaproteobacteria bacterium]MDH5735312.1 cytochrome c-type biogenesis protein CcmH [Gammaproteobacteria bacterium]
MNNKKNYLSLMFLSAMLMLNTAQAKIESLEFANDQMKDDYHSLVAELRCLVCQNQNLADSNAELAQDLRKQVFEMLDKGSSRSDVVDFMVTRYGDFVLYRPPVKTTTLLLWYGPVVLFLIALSIVVVFYRKQTRKSEVVLSDQQKKRAHSLLDN